MNLIALKTELDAGHPVTGVYDADIAVAAGQLNAVNQTRVRAIDITELREWASEDERAYKLFQAQTTGETDQIKNLAIVGISMLNSGQTGLDPSNEMHVEMVNGLVAGGVWTSDDRTALIAKASDDMSRAEKIGIGMVQPGNVTQAREI